MFLLVIGVPSFVALCPYLYFHEVSKVSDSEVNLPLYENVHGFLLGRNDLSSDFDVAETSHMRDVRFVFLLLHALSLVFLSMMNASLHPVKIPLLILTSQSIN